jgi:hypothetical protein
MRSFQLKYNHPEHCNKKYSKQLQIRKSKLPKAPLGKLRAAHSTAHERSRQAYMI